MSNIEREEFEEVLGKVLGFPPRFIIPEECIERVKPIHDLALKLYSAAVMSGAAYWKPKIPRTLIKEKLKDYLHQVQTETREILKEGKAEKFPLEHGLAIAEKAEKLIDEGYIGTAAADLAQAGWTLGEFHMLESARCICSIRSGDSLRAAPPHKTYWELEREREHKEG